MQQYTFMFHFCHIMPKYMLVALATNGTPEQQKMALQALEFSDTVRVGRIISSPNRSPNRSRMISNTGIQRIIYDASGTHNLRVKVVREEGDPPTGDPAVNEAYDGLGWTHAFYYQIYGRDSIDDNGMPLVADVHFGNPHDYIDALWSGENMIFGDGDGVLFNRFTTPLDIIGHELTHGVIDYEAQLASIGQAGALNESISDVFGSMIKQYALNQRVDQADWLIGAGLFTARVHGRALRDMANPGLAYDDLLLGKDPQPAHMSHYAHTLESYGGAHINSGIPNRAFYLAAISIGGYAWERAGRIWYETLRDPRLLPTATFQMFARLTLENTRQLYGLSSDEWTAVKEAWGAVGVLPLGLAVSGSL